MKYEKQKKEKKQKKKNPLLKLKLGELVLEMQRIYAVDPNVIKPENQIPESSLENYKKYSAIILELNKRENEYDSWKPAPRY